VIGVVYGAVVGTDDVPRAYRVVVAIDALVAAGAPAGVAHDEGGPVVHPGQDLLERLVGDELPGRHGPLEELVLAVTVEPGGAGLRWDTYRRRVRNVGWVPRLQPWGLLLDAGASSRTGESRWMHAGP